MSLVGPLQFARPYYHCVGCGQGFCHWDAVLGVQAGRLSPAAAEVVCVAGVQSSFAEASTKVLPKLAGLEVAESTVERTTEAAGMRLAAAPQDETTGKSQQEWAWHRDAEGKTVAYVAVDATGVPQQGTDGGKTESRMANVGVIYNPVPEDPTRWATPAVGPKPPWQARYVASLERMVELGPTLRQQGVAVGMERAERWIALSDGGSGLEDCVQTHFPRVEVVILDFYHAAEYLNDLAKAWHRTDPQGPEALGRQWCQQLKHEGGQAVLDTLQGLDLEIA